MNPNSSRDQGAAASSDEGWHVTDLLALVWRRRILVGGTVLIVSVIALVAAFTITPVYTARATFMAPPEEGSAVSSFLRNPLNVALGRGGTTSIDRLVGFLNSQTTSRIMVERFDLREHYSVNLAAEATRALEDATTVLITDEGIIAVTVTDRDPRLAAGIANTYVEITDSLYREAETKHAGELRRFLEGRVAENREELATAEASARDFALGHGVVSLPDQVSALVDQMATVEAQIRALDVRIGATRHILGPDHYTLREMTAEREQLATQRRSLVESRGRDISDPLLSFRDVPELALEYARLQRTIKIVSLVQELLVQQYEMAKLDELRTTSSLTHVDRAVAPEIRSWPRRGRIVILSGIMGILWAILLATLVEAWPGIRERYARSASRSASRPAGSREAGSPRRGE